LTFKLDTKSVLDHFDAIIFHSPYSKLVRKAFTWLTLYDVQIDPECYDSNLLKYVNTNINVDLLSKHNVIEDTEKLFSKQTARTLSLSKSIGNMYTASIFAGLISYLLSKPNFEVKEKRIALFSFGSGMCSSFYSMTVYSGEKLDILIDYLLQHVPVILEKRIRTSASEFEKIVEKRELFCNKAPFEPSTNIEELFPNSWYLTHIDNTFKRYYKQNNL